MHLRKLSSREDENELKKLDSSVKRNTALVKKLKSTSEDTKDSLLEEIRKTNQSKASNCFLSC